LICGAIASKQGPLEGRRWYSWAVLELEPEADGSDLPDEQGSGHHSLLVRRNGATGEPAWYRCRTPRPVAIGDLVRVAGRRWTVEGNFQAAKSHGGLDERGCPRGAAFSLYFSVNRVGSFGERIERVCDRLVS
jgi:hypothetical protein